ncbi:hypothetical protein [Thalassotalea profundi]|uniref:Lipoprotein n=1 Tax=Thalassotalea profundi TaxID=2036687 RepID=A0ABQ3IIM8_9GAMM|nr:hypothetical protein [Thalassotalea profundi]GHE83841.1 hypothetical protein GCM10011501_10620 [Thalassotalea profundi]
MRASVYLLIVGAFLLCITSCSKPDKTDSKNAILQKIEPTCLVSQSACKIMTHFGELSVLFSEKKITPESEFSILVGNDKFNENFKVTGFIEGKSMYMGKIPLFFSNEQQLGYHIAHTMLGSCSDKKMIWVIQLTVEPLLDNQHKEHYSIEFTSIRE